MALRVAEEGIVATAAAIDSDPDAVYRALIHGLLGTTRSTGTMPNVFVCAACGVRIAMLPAIDFASPRRDELGAAALCDECDPVLSARRDAERRRWLVASRELLQGARRGS